MCSREYESDIINLMKTRIAAATHKPYQICNDELYLHIMAGSLGMSEAETEGYVRDDSGDNISDRNSGFCELTALYWMWKNSDADNIGLCHYRRYFASRHRTGRLRKRQHFQNRRDEFADVIRLDEASELMKRYQVVLPRPRRYFIESNYRQFANSHGAYALDETRRIVAEKHPEYIDAYDRTMRRTTGHRFNMFIMRRDLVDRYCSWLFDILFELENSMSGDMADKKTDVDRIYGHVAERLLDVWLEKEGYDYAELPYVFIGREHLVRKAAAMVMRKIRANKWISMK